jgi:hypothetical protein
MKPKKRSGNSRRGGPFEPAPFKKRIFTKNHQQIVKTIITLPRKRNYHEGVRTCLVSGGA